MRKMDFGALRLMFLAGPLLCLFFLSGCAPHRGVSASINNFIAREDYGRARALVEKSQRQYGPRNQLLYFLDKGLVLHFSGDYIQSNAAFAQAKEEYNQLYTKSITGLLGSMAINDYVMAYSGEDFERVMVNTFTALGYFMSGDLDKALVEARDADETLRLLNSRYGPDQENIYQEDAFARLLMGIFYEARRTPEGYNDAFISYLNAAKTYAGPYARHYKNAAPDLLKENLLSTAQFMGSDEFKKVQAQFLETEFVGLREKENKACVYLIHYNGPSPKKAQIIIPVTLFDGQLVTLALPRYERLLPRIKSSAFTAKTAHEQVFTAQTQVAQNINAIATKAMENKRAGIIAKAVTRAAGKYFAQRTLREVIKKEMGQSAQRDYLIFSNLFNLFTGQADLRSWQTLPFEIRMARLLLEPGEYHFTVDHFASDVRPLEQTDLGTVSVAAGETRFFIIRTAP